MRDFDAWLDTFTESIATYDYYIDFAKVYRNVDDIKIELNIMNSLIGSAQIEADFKALATRYPEILKCLPMLIAVRSNEIAAQDENGAVIYDFKKYTNSIDEYAYFMKATGLFDLLQHRDIKNLVDYVTGVEAGLDSNGRKNRGGHLMEDLVERYIIQAGFVKDVSYFKEMYLSAIEERFNIDLSAISNLGTTEKRFDFVVKTDTQVYGIETNFYTGGGSKLNETARSYKQITLESETIKGFTFLWVTDGLGWRKAKGNLRETFDVLETVYNINELEQGVFKRLK